MLIAGKYAYALALTQSQHRKLQKHLFPEDGCESVAIMLCHRAVGNQGMRLMVSKCILVPAGACSNRTITRVDWPVTEYLTADMISDIDSGGLSIMTIHSHPEGCEEFSSIDNKNDRRLFGAMTHWFDDRRSNGSAIMLPDGKVIARLVDAKGKFTPLDTVSVVGEDIRVWHSTKRVAKPVESGIRVAQTFGKNTLALLRRLRVGVVGCSGTGSVIIELLARNCVGQLVIADPDCVEHKNLNRIINAKHRDAKRNIPKVEMLKKAVQTMGTGTRVDAYQADTYTPQVVRALIDCDVIFGCVDSASGRYHLECIASACWLPYFDVGVRLEADGKGGLTQATVATHYIHPDNASLMARGGYTSEQIAAENMHRSDPERYRKQLKEGYLTAVGEDQPAVISVNMQAACMAFNDFLARLHGFRLDANDSFAIQQMQLVQGYYSNRHAEPGQVDSLFGKYAGMGDASPLLQNITDDNRNA